MKERYSSILKTSLIGIVVNVLLAAAKAVIGVLANSIAITLDAVNNLTDAISSIITIVGIYLAGKDPDKKHPFGYGRIEYLSTLAIAIIIIYAGITAGVESIKGIIHPEKAEYDMVMLGVIVLAVAAKVFLGLFFTKKGKETNSDSLSASGKDALFDAVISTATIVAAIVFLTLGISLEAYLGVIIAIIIVKAGLEILMDTVSKILGEGADAELVRNIKKSVKEHEGVRGAYDLVFHNYGQDVYSASIHVEVEDNMSANEIDIITRHITDDIHKEYGIYLTAIGIYAYNSSNPDVAAFRDKVSHIVLSHKYVNQMHGFYLNEEEKVMRFDMVISFDADSRSGVYDAVMEDLKKEYPDYDISAGMDTDFNEI